MRASRWARWKKQQVIKGLELLNVPVVSSTALRLIAPYLYDRYVVFFPFPLLGLKMNTFAYRHQCTLRWKQGCRNRSSSEAEPSIVLLAAGPGLVDHRYSLRIAQKGQ